MPENNNHKASKPSLRIGSTSGISYGDDVNVLPTVVTFPRGRARMLHKTSRVLTSGRFDSTMISTTSTAPLSHRPPIGIADLVLQPDRYTTLLFANGDPNHLPSTAPGTERHSREISLHVPPSTPLSQSSISMDILPAIFVNEVDSEAEGSITYDAILAPIQEGGFSSLTGISMAIMQGRT
jgi:hypothetical protein